MDATFYQAGLEAAAEFSHLIGLMPKPLSPDEMARRIHERDAQVEAHHRRAAVIAAWLPEGPTPEPMA